MALHNVADVTRSVVKLLEQIIALAGEPALVMPEPPNRVTTDGLGFYLYHIQESAQHKNWPPPGKDPSVGFASMGLNLYYQLSANTSDANDTERTYKEQLWMSIAMKALHDFPEINDNTQIGTTLIFGGSLSHLKGKQNRFKISLQPLPHTEAVQYWTAGQTPIKLSAYYEVSMVFLEPEQSVSYAGKVLAYSVHTFVEGAPQVIGSQNVIAFTIPGENTVRQVEVRPAQVEPSPNAPSPVRPGSKFVLTGTGFAGDQTELMVAHPRWPQPFAVDPAEWNVELIGDNQLVAFVRESVALTAVMLPGIYAAQVRVTRRRVLPNGSTRDFLHISNQFPFTVIPRIDTIAGPAGGIVTVTAFKFRHIDASGKDLLENAIQIYIGEKRILPDKGNGFIAGEYRISADNEIEINLPSGLVSAQVLPLRIIVFGAESPPNWITIP
jgi:hypothetical protein